MAKEQKSPQRKKQLEYTRDYISCGESVHGSRKTWALKKAFINREYRRKPTNCSPNRSLDCRQMMPIWL